jgi:hypothetical protein
VQDQPLGAQRSPSDIAQGLIAAVSQATPRVKAWALTLLDDLRIARPTFIEL